MYRSEKEKGKKQKEKKTKTQMNPGSKPVLNLIGGSGTSFGFSMHSTSSAQVLDWKTRESFRPGSRMRREILRSCSR
jgi:hypothetical protein